MSFEEQDMTEEDFKDVAADDLTGLSEEGQNVDLYELLFDELHAILGKDQECELMNSWLMGDRLRRTLGIITDGEKGTKAFAAVLKRIQKEFGDIHSEESVREASKLSDDFPDMTIFNDLIEFMKREHFREILKLDDDMHRIFYCEMVRQHKWTAAELKEQIDSGLFEKEYGDSEA